MRAHTYKHEPANNLSRYMRRRERVKAFSVNTFYKYLKRIPILWNFKLYLLKYFIHVAGLGNMIACWHYSSPTTLALMLVISIVVVVVVMLTYILILAYSNSTHRKVNVAKNTLPSMKSTRSSIFKICKSSYFNLWLLKSIFGSSSSLQVVQ